MRRTRGCLGNTPTFLAVCKKCPRRFLHTGDAGNGPPGSTHSYPDWAAFPAALFLSAFEALVLRVPSLVDVCRSQIWVARLSKLGIFAPSLAYRSGMASYAQSVKLLTPQCISALRFPAWHAGGQEFESPWLHSQEKPVQHWHLRVPHGPLFSAKRLNIIFCAPKCAPNGRKWVACVHGSTALSRCLLSSRWTVRIHQG